MIIRMTVYIIKSCKFDKSVITLLGIGPMHFFRKLLSQVVQFNNACFVRECLKLKMENIVFKELNFSFMIFLYCFSIFYFINIYSNLYYFLSSACFGFSLLLFFHILKWKVKLLIPDYSFIIYVQDIILKQDVILKHALHTTVLLIIYQTQHLVKYG